MDAVAFVKRTYERFNARDMDAVLAAMHEDVMWANGMEGGHVHGREAVRDYWTRQWAMINARVEPVEIVTTAEGRIEVEVHQVVRDLEGNLLADRIVGHLFLIEGELIKRFDIRET